MIDAHMHCWRPERGDYGWLATAPAQLNRDFLPSDIEDQLFAAGIDGVIAIQAAPSEEETRFLFSLARATDRIRGVVGWLDLAAPDVVDRLAALIADGCGLLKGVRPMLQDMPNPDWIDGAELDQGFTAIVAHDLVFDALVKTAHLPALHRRLHRTPDLRVVIDHAAKPAIAAGGFDEWAAALAPFATMPNVMVKLSGLLTESNGRHPIDPYVEWLRDVFGSDRLIWGSDWPVLTLASDYGSWFGFARAMIPDAAVYYANAWRTYRLERTGVMLVLHLSDNVGVALRQIEAGAEIAPGLSAKDRVSFGFKVALKSIAAGEKIMKYGVFIGSATRDIASGERVHLENMSSDYTATHTRESRE